MSKTNFFVSLSILLSFSLKALTTFQDIPKEIRSKIDKILPPSNLKITNQDIEKIFSRDDNRGACHAASILYHRNQKFDSKNADQILLKLISNQNNNERSIHFGSWTNDFMTPKYPVGRQFVGLCLVIIRENFLKHREYEFRRKINQSLKIAGIGESKYDHAPWQVTNLALQSSALLYYVGKNFKLPKLKEKGLYKASLIYNDLKTHRLLTEFNSPTYYGVNLVALYAWKLINENDFYQMGEEIEEFIWHETANFYHPFLKNIAGPFLRNYSVDMTHKSNLMGLWIASVIGLKDSPLPEILEEKDWIELYLFSMYGHSVSKEDSNRLKNFSTKKMITKYHPKNIRVHGEEMQTYTLIDKNWMIGVATGLTSKRMNHYPLLIHWKQSEHTPLKWLYIGKNQVNIEYDKKNELYHIRLSKYKIKELHLTFSELRNEKKWKIENNILILPGMQVKIYSKVGEVKQNKILENNRSGKRMVRLTWSIPENLSEEFIILSFKPIFIPIQ